jgi:hypothetical protein
MEITIPPTITARYEEDYWSVDHGTGPGWVKLSFGGVEFASIQVTERQHSQLTWMHSNDAEQYREETMCEIVAAWLGERLK